MSTAKSYTVRRFTEFVSSGELMYPVRRRFSGSSQIGWVQRFDDLPAAKPWAARTYDNRTMEGFRTRHEAAMWLVRQDDEMEA